MKRVVIMRGPSGSGKSTLARDLKASADAEADDAAEAVIVSADDYFSRDGEYMFDASQLSAAHADCFRRFIAALISGTVWADYQGDENNLVIVDNTNIHATEIAPYYLGAQAFGWDVVIMQLDTPLDVAAGRGIHGVPPHAVRRMFETMHNEKLPPWWKVEHV